MAFPSLSSLDLTIICLGIGALCLIISITLFVMKPKDDSDGSKKKTRRTIAIVFLLIALSTAGYGGYAKFYKGKKSLGSELVSTSLFY